MPHHNLTPTVITPPHPRSSPLFLTPPFLTPLLFPNEASDARDHLANERNFLSWLRLSIYLCIVSLAITLSLHFKTAPTQLERKIARPLGAVFWGLSLLVLATGVAGYVSTVRGYSRRTAVVQSGWGTRAVGGGVAGVIVGAW